MGKYLTIVNRRLARSSKEICIVVWKCRRWLWNIWQVKSGRRYLISHRIWRTAMLWTIQNTLITLSLLGRNSNSLGSIWRSLRPNIQR